MLSGRDITITVQRVDLGYDVAVDEPTRPIFPVASHTWDDIWIVVQKVDLGYDLMVNYDGFLRFAGDVTVTDDVGLLLRFDTMSENIVVTDHFSSVLATAEVVNDTVVASDAGRVQYYDYAGTDYFVTPYDYVGHREFW